MEADTRLTRQVLKLELHCGAQSIGRRHAPDVLELDLAAVRIASRLEHASRRLLGASVQQLEDSLTSSSGLHPHAMCITSSRCMQ